MEAVGRIFAQKIQNGRLMSVIHDSIILDVLNCAEISGGQPVSIDGIRYFGDEKSVAGALRLSNFRCPVPE
jgi:hypothetical protein